MQRFRIELEGEANTRDKCEDVLAQMGPGDFVIFRSQLAVILNLPYELLEFKQGDEDPIKCVLHNPTGAPIEVNPGRRAVAMALTPCMIANISSCYRMRLT